MIGRPTDLEMSEPELLLEIISLFIDDQLLESHTITEMLRPSFYRLSPSQLRVLMRRDPVAVDSRNEREVHSYDGGWAVICHKALPIVWLVPEGVIRANQHRNN